MEIFDRVRGLHSKLADDVTDKVGIGYLVCRDCGLRAELDKDRIARYLASGWPECHGTMSWVTQRQIDAGEESP